SSSVADPGPVLYSVPGNYSVTLSVTNECGTTTVTSPIIVHPSPLVKVPADISVCAGETIGPLNFTSTPVAVSFSWTNSNPAIGIAASGNNNLIPAFTANNN